MDIVLTWTDNSDNETGFHIYRSIDGAEQALLEDVGPDISTFTDADVLPGTYVYMVSAFNAAGESARIASNEVIVAAVPAAPSNLVAALVA